MLKVKNFLEELLCVHFFLLPLKSRKLKWLRLIVYEAINGFALRFGGLFFVFNGVIKFSFMFIFCQENFLPRELPFALWQPGTVFSYQ